MKKKTAFKPNLALWREPYLTIINLFLAINNEPLSSNQLHYILLEKHGIKKLNKSAEINSDFSSQILQYNGKKYPLSHIRSEFGMNLRSTIVKKNGTFMTGEGLRTLFRRLKRNNVLISTKNGFMLEPEYYNKCINYQFSEIAKLPLNEEVALTRRGVFEIYHPYTDSDLGLYLLSGGNEPLESLIKDLENVWARRKIEAFINAIIEDESITLDPSVLGYCIYMCSWFLKRVGIADNSSFNKDLSRISLLAKDKDVGKKARLFHKGIIKMIEKMEEIPKISESKKARLAKEWGWKLPERYRLTDILSHLSWQNEMSIEKAIETMSEAGLINNKDKDFWSIQSQVLKSYEDKGLHKYMSNQLFLNSPVIYIDFKPPRRDVQNPFRPMSTTSSTING